MGATFGLWAFLQAGRFDRRMALDTAELVLINSVVLAKVYSPQYLIWTVPLALLWLSTFCREAGSPGGCWRP